MRREGDRVGSRLGDRVVEVVRTQEKERETRERGGVIAQSSVWCK
jgi:hypothetical protein